MLKATFNGFILGVAVGCVMFVLTGIINQFTIGVEATHYSNFALFAFQNMGITGVAFAVAGFLYDFEKPRLIFKILIHWLAVMLTFTLVAVLPGNFSFENIDLLVRVYTQMTIQFFVVWGIVWIVEKGKEKQVNEALKKYQGEKTPMDE